MHYLLPFGMGFCNSCSFTLLTFVFHNMSNYPGSPNRYIEVTVIGFQRLANRITFGMPPILFTECVIPQSLTMTYKRYLSNMKIREIKHLLSATKCTPLHTVLYDVHFASRDNVHWYLIHIYLFIFIYLFGQNTFESVAFAYLAKASTTSYTVTDINYKLYTGGIYIYRYYITKAE